MVGIEPKSKNKLLQRHSFKNKKKEFRFQYQVNWLTNGGIIAQNIYECLNILFEIRH